MAIKLYYVDIINTITLQKNIMMLTVTSLLAVLIFVCISLQRCNCAMPIHLYKNSADVQFWQHCMFLLAMLFPSMLDECEGSTYILWRLINQIIYKKNKKQKLTNRCPG